MTYSKAATTVHGIKPPAFYVAVEIRFPRLTYKTFCDATVYAKTVTSCVHDLYNYMDEKDKASYFNSMGIPARLENENRMRIHSHPTDRKRFRFFLPFSCETDTHSGSEVIKALVQKALPAALTRLPKKTPVDVVDVAVARTRSRKPLVAGFASPEEIDEQLRWLPGERIEWPDDQSEKAHPNTRVERMDGNVAHCFDDNGETFTVNYLPV